MGTSLRPLEAAVAATAAILLTVVLTWPLAADLGTVGRVDSGDGRYSVWNVTWVAHALTTNPLGLYDANIFSPHEGTLAFSEANLFAGVLAIPVWLITRNPYAAANWAVLCAFVLAALSMYGLARHVTGSRAGGALAGLKYAFSAYAFSHIPQIQLLMTFGPALALLQMHRFVERPSTSRAGMLGVVLALQGVACGYYGVFGGLAVGLGLLWFGVALGHWRAWRYWALVLLAGVVAIALVAPFFAPYLDIRSAGFQRSLDEARIFSVRWRSYLASPMLLYQWILPLIGAWREVLFPGLVPFVLACSGVFMTFRRSRDTRPTIARSTVGFYVALAGLAVWASLGPDAGLYTLFYKTVPFFSLLRAPARFGLLVTLAVAVLGGVGVALIQARLMHYRRPAFVLVVLCLGLASSTVGSLGLVAAPRPSKVHAHLARLPRAPVAEFPYFTGPIDRHRHTEYMLMSTFHWQPLVNGYSDHIPEDAFEAMPTLSAFPQLEAWHALRDRDVRYVVVHWNLYSAEEREHVRRSLDALHDYAVPLFRGAESTLFQILKWPESALAGINHQPFR